MTLEEVKTLLMIKDDKYDDYILSMLPLVEDYIKHTCNREDIPIGLQPTIAKMIEFNMNKAGLQSRNLGDISFSYSTDYPESITKDLRSYRRVRFV